jgi:hypothetical protein
MGNEKRARCEDTKELTTDPRIIDDAPEFMENEKEHRHDE